MSLNKQTVAATLKKVKSPAGNVSIAESGELKNVQVFGKEIDIDLEIKSPALNIRKKLEGDILSVLTEEYGEVQVRVNIAAKPVQQGPQGPPTLSKVKNIIAVASGKGGVGKSTVTANLAVGLVNQGFKVGLIDADIYGPSMPLMFDIVHEKPQVKVIEGKQYMLPIESYGVKVMSIGFFSDPTQAIVWRGPMATKALKQMFGDVWWDELDYLLLDLPPGTGDVHLTIVQAVPVTGAVVVSTPQEVALTDARKGVAMFRLDSINVPVIGLIENMAWFTPAELPNNKYYIFGKDGVKGLAEQIKVPLLGQIPLVQSIRESGDVGRPALLQEDTQIAETFKDLASAVIKEVEARNGAMQPTKKVEITTQ
ncbi:MAG: ATP-binding protein involved in chromosome partitioning [Bacteroidia bacterium]|jgi:ATP-binding protein involved in chromosome partitioning